MRPDNIWDVLSNTADYASEAIPAYQREKRDLATQERQFGLRAAAGARQQESLDNYRQSQLGFQLARLDAANQKEHPTAHPSFDAVLADIMLNPGKYPASVVADFKAAAAERHPGPKEPEPKRAPNFVGDIQGDYEQRLGRWTRRRQDAATGFKAGYALARVGREQGGRAAAARPASTAATSERRHRRWGSPSRVATGTARN